MVPLWNMLKDIARITDVPWFVIGDFNLIGAPEDKWGEWCLMILNLNN